MRKIIFDVPKLIQQKPFLKPIKTLLLVSDTELDLFNKINPNCHV